MFEVLAKFFRFSGKKNSAKFKRAIAVGVIEALASAMKIPAIMYILMGIIEGEGMGKYIAGSLTMMGIACIVSIFCKMRSTMLQTEGGYNSTAFKRIEIAEHLRYLPIAYCLAAFLCVLFLRL